jgi:Neuraminidase (sialidase)
MAYGAMEGGVVPSHWRIRRTALLKKAGSVIALGGILALVVTTSGLAKGPTQATLIQVSGPPPSPLAGCSNAGQTGRNYLDAEVEPQAAVHGRNVVAMWHQDRWSNGGAHGIGVGFSSDGGKTWAQSTLPVDMCSSGTPASLSFYQRASDPWVAFGPDGTAYASALSFNRTDNKNAVAAATSTDGGATWDNVQPIPGSVFTTSQFSTDKNATTADPVTAGTAYTVWDTLVLATDHPDDNPHTQAYTGPTYFSKTTDGGHTWSQATIIVDTAQRQQTIGNIIVVDPRDGTLYDFTDLIVSPNTPFQGTRSNAQLAFVKSTDGGDTWTAPHIVGPFNSLGVIDPNTGQRLRVGDILEEVAIDPASGKLYAVYESSTNYSKNLNQSSGAWDNEILLVTSSDGGTTWKGPSVIHALASGLPTFTPTVAVNGGTVAVTYYDNRNLTPGQTANLPTDYWVKYSTDGGVTFGSEHHIAGPFDQLTAPFARGFFLGDYEGLQPSGSGFLAVFVKTNCNATDAAGQFFPTGGPCASASSTATATSNTNPTDVFSAYLTP